MSGTINTLRCELHSYIWFIKLKGHRHNLGSNFKKRSFFILRMVNLGIFNSFSKFENQILSYNQDTGLCNKA